MSDAQRQLTDQKLSHETQILQRDSKIGDLESQLRTARDQASKQSESTVVYELKRQLREQAAAVDMWKQKAAIAQEHATPAHAAGSGSSHLQSGGGVVSPFHASANSRYNASSGGRNATGGVTSPIPSELAGPTSPLGGGVPQSPNFHTATGGQK